MSWNSTHHRHRLVHAVLDDVARTGAPEIPARWRAEIDAEFGGSGGFLLEVQRRWYRAFDAHLDPLLERRPEDMRAALIRLWHELARTMPAARLLLDAHIDHPDLETLHGNHRRMLHWATGVRLALVLPAPAAAEPGPAPGKRFKAMTGGRRLCRSLFLNPWPADTPGGTR